MGEQQSMDISRLQRLAGSRCSPFPLHGSVETLLLSLRLQKIYSTLVELTASNCPSVSVTKLSDRLCLEHRRHGLYRTWRCHLILSRCKTYALAGDSGGRGDESFEMAGDPSRLAKAILQRFLDHLRSSSTAVIAASLSSLPRTLPLPADFFVVEAARGDMVVCQLIKCYRLQITPLVDALQVLFYGPGEPESRLLNLVLDEAELMALLSPVIGDFLAQILKFFLWRITGIADIYAVDRNHHLGLEWRTEAYVFGLSAFSHIFLQLAFHLETGDMEASILSPSKDHASMRIRSTHRLSAAQLWTALDATEHSNPCVGDEGILEAILKASFEWSGIVAVQSDDRSLEIVNAPVIYPTTRCRLRTTNALAQVRLSIDEEADLEDVAVPCASSADYREVVIELELAKMGHLVSFISRHSLSIHQAWLAKAAAVTAAAAALSPSMM